MDFLELAEKRYSCRKFKDTPVAQEEIDKILKAGHLAPTACNYQPQKIIVVNSEKGLETFRANSKYHFNAPLAFIVCVDNEKSWKRGFDGKNSGDIDASIVATHMMLEAAELGIGSTWIMCYDPALIDKAFGIEGKYSSVAILACGYPADEAKPSHLHNEFRDMKDYVEYV